LQNTLLKNQVFVIFAHVTTIDHDEPQVIIFLCLDFTIIFLQCDARFICKQSDQTIQS